MKKLLLTLVLVSSQVYAHGHHHHHGEEQGLIEQGTTWSSILLNIAGLFNHACQGCSSKLSIISRAYHVIDPAIHIGNIAGGAWRVATQFFNIDSYPSLLSSASLGFNLLGIWGQTETIIAHSVTNKENATPRKLLIAVLTTALGAVDLWGHLTGAAADANDLKLIKLN